MTVCTNLPGMPWDKLGLLCFHRPSVSVCKCTRPSVMHGLKESTYHQHCQAHKETAICAAGRERHRLKFACTRCHTAQRCQAKFKSFARESTVAWGSIQSQGSWQVTAMCEASKASSPVEAFCCPAHGPVLLEDCQIGATATLVAAQGHSCAVRQHDTKRPWIQLEAESRQCTCLGFDNILGARTSADLTAHARGLCSIVCL